MRILSENAEAADVVADVAGIELNIMFNQWNKIILFQNEKDFAKNKQKTAKEKKDSTKSSSIKSGYIFSLWNNFTKFI